MQIATVGAPVCAKGRDAHEVQDANVHLLASAYDMYVAASKALAKLYLERQIELRCNTIGDCEDESKLTPEGREYMKEWDRFIKPLEAALKKAQGVYE